MGWVSILIISKKVTPKGHVVLRVLYSADPEKDEAWLEAEKQKCPDLASFQREYLCDWSSTSGMPFYVLFNKRNLEDPKYYVRTRELSPNLPVCVGLDFGRYRPAACFFQVVDGFRVHVHREIMPENCDSHTLRDLLMYAGGLIGRGDKSLNRRPRALEIIEALSDTPHPMPWFPGERGIRFIWFSGPECYKSMELTGERGERNAYEVFQDRGLDIEALPQRVSAGEHIISLLIQPHPDGKGPGLTLDPQCQILIRGLAGGITRARPTKNKPMTEDVVKDGFYEHLHDALRYGVVGTIPITEGELNDIIRNAKRPQDEGGTSRGRYSRGSAAYGGSIEIESGYASLDSDQRYFSK